MAVPPGEQRRSFRAARHLAATGRTAKCGQRRARRRCVSPCSRSPPDPGYARTGGLRSAAASPGCRLPGTLPQYLGKFVGQAADGNRPEPFTVVKFEAALREIAE